MNKAGWALVGLLVGILLMTSVPVTAHHSDRRIKNRLSRLEDQVLTLRTKMRLLDNGGFYHGPVFGYQVIGYCTAGQTAIWEVSTADPDFSAIDDCQVSQRRAASDARVWSDR